MDGFGEIEFEFYTLSPCNRYLVPHRFICTACGKLKFPIKFYKFSTEGKNLYRCLWCEKIVTDKQIKQSEHILWCKNPQVLSFGEANIYCCACYY